MPPPGAPTPELLVARFRGHARRLAWSALVLIAVAGACGYFYGNLPAPFENWMLLAAGAARRPASSVVLPYLAWWARTYTITTRRVIRALRRARAPPARAGARARLHDPGAQRPPAAHVGSRHADALQRRRRAAAPRRTSRASTWCTRRSSIRSRSARSSRTATRSRSPPALPPPRTALTVAHRRARMMEATEGAHGAASRSRRRRAAGPHDDRARRRARGRAARAGRGERAWRQRSPRPPSATTATPRPCSRSRATSTSSPSITSTCRRTCSRAARRRRRRRAPGPDALLYAQDKLAHARAARRARDAAARLGGRPRRRRAAGVPRRPRRPRGREDRRAAATTARACAWSRRPPRPRTGSRRSPRTRRGGALLAEELVDFTRELAQQVARRPSGDVRRLPGRRDGAARRGVRRGDRAGPARQRAAARGRGAHRRRRSPRASA